MHVVRGPAQPQNPCRSHSHTQPAEWRARLNSGGDCPPGRLLLGGRSCSRRRLHSDGESPNPRIKERFSHEQLVALVCFTFSSISRSANSREMSWRSMQAPTLSSPSRVRHRSITSRIYFRASRRDAALGIAVLSLRIFIDVNLIDREECLRSGPAGTRTMIVM